METEYLGYDLAQLLESVEEAIVESGPSYRIWMVVEGACSKLGIVVPGGNNEDEAEDADQEFVAAVRSEYGEVIEEFETIVRSFYESSDKLEFLKKIRGISFFY